MDKLQAQRREPSLEDPPDSAIELSSDETPKPDPPVARHSRSQSSPHAATPAIHQIDEFLDELHEMPYKPPVLPPRSRARTLSTNQRPKTSDSRYGSSLTLAASPGEEPRRFELRSNHQRGWSFEPATAAEVQNSNPSPRDTRPQTQDSRFLRPVNSDARIHVHVEHHLAWENPRANVPTPGRPSTSSSALTSSTQARANPVRRSSSRLSMAFRSFSIRRKTQAPTLPPAVDPTSTAIFGVPLEKSMLVAKGISGTRHDGGGTSTRDFPLCVLRCFYHIRDVGITAPDIFGREADAMRLAELKNIFSSPETGYGKVLDWNQFSVYEAADLILHFLSSLPTPLVPESVAKRWIVLSRQATISGSHAVRLDQGLDFWEEAFAGLRNHQRSLFKLLLNLWGEVADAADDNDMTAERLAGRVVRPLMHVSATKYDTDFVLGLAFMIRKRSEHILAVEGKGRTSNAAF